MNIAFFITPKHESVCLEKDATMRQALEKMEYHRYTAIPIVDKQGRYVGTLTEGDLLWKMKNTPNLTFEGTNKISLKKVPKNMSNHPVSINAEIEEVVDLIMKQNFVPVVDDQEIFVGIITRKSVMSYLRNIAAEEIGNTDNLRSVSSM
ncbi:CBS domain-containing protein [Isachenkonia alkalipeptolytica]|uniref:CBS domain-containing protein n=1 Tax=Isachenkonia alkalipeptolytica TaxID=2565777 RepID=A0AA44BD78_9CLOT|nr:CBS domain-containing protein [Isachenkonia alkalipeptolytica]NBG87642.1 CBS domain-containing protein [Isachenkonia alkalipeptolytica]